MKTLLQGGVVIASLFVGIALGRDIGALVITKYLPASSTITSAS